MWVRCEGRVKYSTTHEWYEVEIDGCTAFVRGASLDEKQAFAIVALYFSDFDIENIFSEIQVDYEHDVITYEG